MVCQSRGAVTHPGADVGSSLKAVPLSSSCICFFTSDKGGRVRVLSGLLHSKLLAMIPDGVLVFKSTQHDPIWGKSSLSFP